MGIASEPKGRGITVTIKYGKGYEDAWAVFHGLADEVRDDILSFFDIDRESVTGLSLSDLVVNATGTAHAVGNVAGYLGGTVIASQATPDSQAAEPAPHPLLAVIEQTPDVPALKRIWAENQDAFTDPAVMAAWKAKGRALNQRA